VNSLVTIIAESVFTLATALCRHNIFAFDTELPLPHRTLQVHQLPLENSTTFNASSQLLNHGSCINPLFLFFKQFILSEFRNFLDK
jgi:hypothetical protein